MNNNKEGKNSRLERYRSILPWLVLGAVVAGGGMGLILRAWGISAEDVEKYNLGMPGDLFLRCLKMVVVPLIAAAIINGITGVDDIRKLGRLGIWISTYYVCTTAAAAALGLLLVNLIQPGKGVDLSLAANVPADLTGTAHSFKELIYSLVSTNPIGDAAADLSQGRLLPMLMFCILFGVILATLKGEPQRVLQAFFDGLYQIMMKIVDLVILFTPIGVFFLLLRTMAVNGVEVIGSIGLFGLTVLTGLVLHAFVVLPMLVKVIGNRNPFALFRDVAPALLTAFSTCSSSATIPVSIDRTVNKAGIPKQIANFALPLGATVNMNGTSLYEAVAALFIARAYGIDLSIVDQVIVLVVATLTAIGAAGIPSASLVMIAVVLGAVGLPLSGIGLILALDRLLDMGRTAVNVWGDITGAAIYHGLEIKRVSRQKDS